MAILRGQRLGAAHDGVELVVGEAERQHAGRSCGDDGIAHHAAKCGRGPSSARTLQPRRWRLTAR